MKCRLSKPARAPKLPAAEPELDRELARVSPYTPRLCRGVLDLFIPPGERCGSRAAIAVGVNSMPTDSVKNRTFKDAFNGTVRFEIPFFQRGYAWERRQWDQLFVDIQEQIIDELNSGSAIDEVELFFGPIVVLEKTGGLELKEFHVIDGQQRITTVYLLLAIIREELKRKENLSADATHHVQTLNSYLVNVVTSSDDYLKLKVFSSKGDRLPTYRVVFGSDMNPRTPMLQTDLQLYVPGKNRVDEFHKYALRKVKGQCKDVPALWQLAEALLNCLKIVWIPLSEKDDPQAIFESLNDKGIPLRASELLCNFIFRLIIEAREEHENLHNDQWLATIRALGDDDAFEDYLRNLFSIGEPKMVGRFRKVYVHFKVKNRDLTPTGAKQQLSDIHSSAFLYRNIKKPLDHPHANNQLNEILIAINNTRMDSSTPFVLSVLRDLARGNMQINKAKAVLREVLVLLVRRKMTELPTTQYDTMFPQLLQRIQHEPSLERALHDQFRRHSVWISDQEFEDALIHRATYRSRDLPFSRMILIEIDKKLQCHGQLPDYTTLNTIEHTLPQTLDAAWKQYLGTDARDEHLEILTNSIGNLCLLSGPANSSVGQDPFDAKRNAYSPITALARRMKEHPGPWNLAAIREQSKSLVPYALEIWVWSVV
jgi:uncharacterized protein with ParB-like and HNH nuclease domain